jgi:hypothetical protein
VTCAAPGLCAAQACNERTTRVVTGTRPEGGTDDGPNIARVYNYLAGGSDNFAADRAAAEELLRVNPDAARVALDNKAWTARAVRWIAAPPRSVAQYLDLGAGLPLDPMPHEIARDAIPCARTVYVDNDPVAAEHLAVLAASSDGSAAAAVADLRDTGEVLAQAGKTLDLAEPVCVILAAVLHFAPADEAREIVGAYADAAPPGSYVAVSSVFVGDESRVPQLQRSYTAAAIWSHSPAELESFFAGLDIVPPGVTPARRWRGGWDPSDATPSTATEVMAAVGLKRR